MHQYNRNNFTRFQPINRITQYSSVLKLLQNTLIDRITCIAIYTCTKEETNGYDIMGDCTLKKIQKK